MLLLAIYSQIKRGLVLLPEAGLPIDVAFKTSFIYSVELLGALRFYFLLLVAELSEGGPRVFAALAFFAMVSSKIISETLSI